VAVDHGKRAHQQRAQTVNRVVHRFGQLRLLDAGSKSIPHDREDQVLFAGEVAVDRADAHAGAFRDLFHLGGKPALAEDRACGFDETGAIGAGICAFRRMRDVDVHFPRQNTPDRRA
jgi:hypothetical protein